MARAGALGMVNLVTVPAGVVEETVARLADEASGPIGINFLMPFLDVAAGEAAAPHCRVVEFSMTNPAVCWWRIGK